MKAIVAREFGAPEVLTLEEVPLPTPGPGQVRIGVKAAGVNPVDVYVLSGTHARMPALPYTPGLDTAGIIEAVGPNVASVTTGDRVYTHGTVAGYGGYAEATLCSESQVYPLPPRLSFAQGAALGVPYATAWRALLTRANARPGETVLIHGASGGVGTAAVQIARAHGMRVIGTAGTNKGRQLVHDQGAHAVFNHHDPDYLAQVMSFTNNRGVDVIIEMLANVNLDRDLDVVAPGGRIVIVGSRGRTEIDPRKIMRKDAAIDGLMLFNATTDEQHVIRRSLAASLEDGTLNPVIGREFPLTDAACAMAAVMEPGALGKIVLIP